MGILTLVNNPIGKASIILLESTILVGLTMSFVYYFGKNSIISTIIIYTPISTIIIQSIYKKYSYIYIFSCLLAIIHGLAHIKYPFLNEEIGVDKTIDIWQDQIIHLSQSILATIIFFNTSNLLFKMFSSLFILVNVFNVFAGYNCWGEHCHYIYTWISLAPSLSSGLHFAIGCFFQSSRQVAICGFLIQGSSAIITNLLFKESNEMLKLFALCRFFEIYFIVPHYIGYINSIYNSKRKLIAINTFNKLRVNYNKKYLVAAHRSYFN